MIGDGLSHVGFGALAVASALNLAPLLVSIPIVVLSSFLLLKVSENSKIKGDASIALMSTSAMAIGVIVISMTKGLTIDVCNYLFGSILAMTMSDVYLSIALSVIVIILFVVFYNRIFAITFDETFARATGVRAGVYNMLIALLTAVTITLGMRMMGALLISSLIIFPSLTSMRLCKTFKGVIACSVIISMLCFFMGIVISYVYASPTGASIVVVNIVMFAVFSLSALLKKRGKKKYIAVVSASVLFILTACKADFFEKGLDIKEKFFITQINDIYLNPNNYLGTKIRYEGIFDVYDIEDGKKFYSVFRYGPGCCGPDAYAGFEIIWEDKSKEYPRPNDWVEVIGVLEMYEADKAKFLRIKLSSLKVLEKRGKENLLSAREVEKGEKA
jgi:zinc transport system permease protein